MPRAPRIRRQNPDSSNALSPVVGLPPPAALPPPAILYTGRLIGLADHGRVRVLLDGGTESHLATYDGLIDATVVAQTINAGGSVVLRADAGGLVVLGMLQPLTVPARREVSAGEQLVLRSGDASLTLTAAGKVLLRGAYVSSWSNGVNRIVGRTVRLD